MRTVAMMMLLGMFVVGGSVGIPDSSASEFQSQCIQDAIATRQECKALCQENFQMDKDECWDVPHECAETRRSARETCVDEALDDLDVCLIPVAIRLRPQKKSVAYYIPKSLKIWIVALMQPSLRPSFVGTTVGNPFTWLPN